MLSNLAGSRTAAQREVQRAKVLLAYAQGKSPEQDLQAGSGRLAEWLTEESSAVFHSVWNLSERWHE